MVCPKCGNNMSWREPKCPVCGAVNPTQKKERARKRRRRRRNRPILLGLLVIALVILFLILRPKGDKDTETPDTTTLPTSAQSQEQESPQPSEPEQTEAPTTKPTSPDDEFVPNPADYGSLSEFATSEGCAALMRQRQAKGDGKPARYAVVELNVDGEQQLLVMSGAVDGYYDTLVFTANLKLSTVITSYDPVMLAPADQALAFQPYAPLGSLEDGTYSGGHNYYKLHAASGAMYPLFSIGLDEGVPLKDMGGVTQTISMEEWQESLERLFSPVWIEIR